MQPNIQTVIEQESALILFEYHPIISVNDLSVNQSYIVASLLSNITERVDLSTVQIIQQSSIQYSIQYMDPRETQE